MFNKVAVQYCCEAAPVPAARMKGAHCQTRTKSTTCNEPNLGACTCGSAAGTSPHRNSPPHSQHAIPRSDELAIPLFAWTIHRLPARENNPVTDAHFLPRINWSPLHSSRRAANCQTWLLLSLCPLPVGGSWRSPCRLNRNSRRSQDERPGYVGDCAFGE